MRGFPVVFASDAGYAYPMTVAIYSLFESAKKTTKYQVIALVSPDFPNSVSAIVANMAKRYDMPDVQFIQMGSAYQTVKMNYDHITHATYFRLRIPSLLSEWDKCLYLDADVLVRGDLSELFYIDMEGYDIAGAKAGGYHYPPERGARYAESLGIDNLDHYVNAGVLLMNLAGMRAEHRENDFEELVPLGLTDQDQGILNRACFGRILLLGPKFNMLASYGIIDPCSYELPHIRTRFSRQEWEEGCANPVIVHFASSSKPWTDISTDYTEAWWDYAFRAGIGEQCWRKFFSRYAKSSGKNKSK